MSVSTRTPFTETEALLAVMEGDPDRCQEILAGFLDGELRTFRDQIHLLDDLCRRDQQRRVALKVQTRSARPAEGADHD